jgi:hypothetical protein
MPETRDRALRLNTALDNAREQMAHCIAVIDMLRTFPRSMRGFGQPIEALFMDTVRELQALNEIIRLACGTTPEQASHNDLSSTLRPHTARGRRPRRPTPEESAATSPDRGRGGTRPALPPGVPAA